MRRDQASLLSVLETAIPSSVVSLAATNPAALASDLASSISASQTPDWVKALPTDVRSMLPQLIGTTKAAVSSASAASTSAASGGALPSGNSTGVTSVKSASLTSTGKGSATSAASTGGAAYPTGVVGAGVAGAVGVLGMLVL